MPAFSATGFRLRLRKLPTRKGVPRSLPDEKPVKSLLPPWLWLSWIENEPDPQLRELLAAKFEKLAPQGTAARVAGERELRDLLFPRPPAAK